MIVLLPKVTNSAFYDPDRLKATGHLSNFTLDENEADGLIGEYRSHRVHEEESLRGVEVLKLPEVQLSADNHPQK